MLKKYVLGGIVLSCAMVAAQAYRHDAAIVGGVVGGIAGAAIGANLDDRDGAVVGGVIGAATGALIGSNLNYRDRGYRYYHGDRGNHYYRGDRGWHGHASRVYLAPVPVWSPGYGTWRRQDVYRGYQSGYSGRVYDSRPGGDRPRAPGWHRERAQGDWRD